MPNPGTPPRPPVPVIEIPDFRTDANALACPALVKLEQTVQLFVQSLVQSEAYKEARAATLLRLPANVNQNRDGDNKIVTAGRLTSGETKPLWPGKVSTNMAGVGQHFNGS